MTVIKNNFLMHYTPLSLLLTIIFASHFAPLVGNVFIVDGIFGARLLSRVQARTK